MIKRYQVLLLAVPVIFGIAHAAPLEFVVLNPQTEVGEVRGEVAQGDMRSYRLSTQRKSIRFTIDATSMACSLEVRKVPETVPSKRIARFPSDYAENTRPGDQFTFVFAQSRDAWVNGVPCKFNVKFNGG